MGSYYPQNLPKVAEAHGILGSLAFCFFMPLGAILIRVLNGRSAFWSHVGVMILGLCLLISDVGTGIWVSSVFGDYTSYHPMIGLVLFGLTMLQPIWGWTSHFIGGKKTTTSWAGHIHKWMGRCLITLGIIQGGLGLLYSYSKATTGQDVAYGVISAAIWLSFVSVAAKHELGYDQRHSSVTTDREKAGSTTSSSPRASV